MSTLEILKAEGTAEGSIKTILSLLEGKVITREQAQVQLQKLADKGEISVEQLREALKQIKMN